MFPQTVDEFMGMCAKCGMNTRDAKWAHKIVRPPPRDRDQSREQAVGMLRDSIRSLPARPVLALVILSNDDKILYAGIKCVRRIYMPLTLTSFGIGRFLM